MKHSLTSLLSLALVLCLCLAVCACGKTEPASSAPESEPSSGQAESAPAGNGTSVQINGKTLTFGSTDRHGDMLFGYSDDPGFLKSAVYAVCELTYQPEGVPLFNIHIVYFSNSTVETVLEGSDYETRHETRNGLDFLCFDYEENGRPGTTYVYPFEGTVYTISFVSEYDRTSLIDGFMSTVSFES